MNDRGMVLSILFDISCLYNSIFLKAETAGAFCAGGDLLVEFPTEVPGCVE